MNLKYLSVCSGIEAASVAWKPLGWEPIAFAEVADFPSEVLKYHYPDVPNLGDITQFDQWDSSYKPDVLIGGIPCFVEETLVLTKEGLKQIKSIKEGDLVWTHKNRWKKVVRAWKTGNKEIMNVHTSMTEVLCTDNHPFYTLEGDLKDLKPQGHDGYLSDKEFKEFEKLTSWTEAWDLRNKFLSFPSLGKNDNIVENEVFKAVIWQLEETFKDTYLVNTYVLDPLKWKEYEQKNKKLLKNDNRLRKVFDTSYAIISHLHGVNISGEKTNPIKKISGYAFARGGIKPLGYKDVYNIEVEDDNSYVANGIIVHNCQAYSIAGLRQGLEDAKGRGKPLMFSYLGIIRKYKPRYVIFENVPGILTQDNGTAFNTLLQGLSMCGYDDISWRVINAEDFCVAQERNRLFLVASNGKTASSQRILFKQTRMSRDSGQNGTEKQNDSTDIGGSPKGANSFGFGASIVTTIKENKDDYPLDIWEIHNGEPRLKLKKSICMIARWGTGGNNVPIVEETKSYKYNGLTKPDNVPTVRKFTPEECEKLQAFPIGYTKIPYKGKGKEFCPTAKRYQALGNSMCTNVIKWLGERIEMVERGEL